MELPRCPEQVSDWEMWDGLGQSDLTTPQPPDYTKLHTGTDWYFNIINTLYTVYTIQRIGAGFQDTTSDKISPSLSLPGLASVNNYHFPS